MKTRYKIDAYTIKTKPLNTNSNYNVSLMLWYSGSLLALTSIKDTATDKEILTLGLLPVKNKIVYYTTLFFIFVFCIVFYLRA